MNTWSYFFLVIFPILASCQLDVETPFSQGPCPDGWVDGSLVDMGCLYFNLTEPMTWLESLDSCQIGNENASAVEIISAEVEIHFLLPNLYS